jgi:predicted molibdopterin-dependent oxidoreductase YjgC
MARSVLRSVSNCTQALNSNTTPAHKSLEPFTLEFAAKTCGLTVELLKQVAQMIVEANGVCILWAMGITQHSMGSDSSTAISNLLLVTENYMRTGTGAYPLRGHNNVQGAGDHGAHPENLTGYRVLIETVDPLIQKFGFLQAIIEDVAGDRA